MDEIDLIADGRKKQLTSSQVENIKSVSPISRSYASSTFSVTARARICPGRRFVRRRARSATGCRVAGGIAAPAPAPTIRA